MSVQSPTTEQACPVRHALTRQPHRAATRRMAAAGFHKVQAGRIDHSLSPRRRARFLAKSSPAATFFVLSRASTKNLLIVLGTSDSRAASRPECVRHGGNTVCTKWRQNVKVKDGLGSAIFTGSQRGLAHSVVTSVYIFCGHPHSGGLTRVHLVCSAKRSSTSVSRIAPSLHRTSRDGLPTARSI